ncbi:MAG: hypothetical protein SH807_09075 [Blastochloris sp.]|nr:hypothetical protein [Blastochloris sp.]
MAFQHRWAANEFPSVYCYFKLDGLNGLLQAGSGIGGLVPQAEGALGVPAVLGELGDECLLRLGDFGAFGSEGGAQIIVLNEKGVDRV